MNNPNSRQAGGAHYGLTPWQHWDYVIEAGLGYFEAAATKYIVRHRSKNGYADLQKASHYIEKLIWAYENKGFAPLLRVRPDILEMSSMLYKLTQLYNLNDAEQRACRLLSIWYDRSDLLQAQYAVDGMMAAYLTEFQPQPQGYVNQD
jgi:hypothetical protein